MHRGKPLKREIEDALLALPSIECVHIDEQEGVEYEQRQYDVLAYAQLRAGDRSVSIAIGVPKRWWTSLFDFYLVDYSQEFPFIPHVESDGKICIVDMDLVQVDPYAPLHDLLAECVNRVVELIEKGLAHANQNDFIDEFELYWMRLPFAGKCLLDVSPSEATHSIQYVSLNKNPSRNHQKKRKRGRLVKESCLEKSSVTPIINLGFAAANAITLGNDWGWSGTVHNGAYFDIQPERPLYPPDFRSPLSMKYINNLLSLVPKSKLDRKMKKCKAPFVAVFNIHEPTGKTVTIAALIQRGAIVLQENSPRLQADSEVLPLWVKRVDRETLMGRVLSNVDDEKDQRMINPFENVNVLLVGCGSIGGYVSALLAKSGCTNLSLVDPDTFSEENLFRHVLGKESVGKKKAKALKEYLCRSLPGLNVTSFPDKMENVVSNKELNLHDYGVIISAVGNHTVNLELNRILSEEHIESKTFFAWNEPLDLGCHVAFIPSTAYSTPCCLSTFESLFSHNSGGIYEMTAYCEQGQQVSRRVAGCGSSYIPYGAEVSVKSALIVVDLVKRALLRKMLDAVIFSEKGEGYWFRKEGLLTSAVYDEQKDIRVCRRIADLAINAKTEEPSR